MMMMMMMMTIVLLLMMMMMMMMMMDTLHTVQHEFLQALAPSSLDFLQYPETDFLPHYSHAMSLYICFSKS
jgi:hypothetical protein